MLQESLSGGQLLANQLVIRVEGWTDVSPVVVDSVGTYFRLVRRAPGKHQGVVLVSYPLRRQVSRCTFTIYPIPLT